MSLNYKQNDELIPLYQSGISPDQMDKTETDANNCVPIDTDIKVYRVGNSSTNIPIQQAGIIESFVYRDSGNVRVTQRYTVNYNTSGTPTFTRTAIGDDNSLTWSAWSTFDNYSTDEQVVGRWIDGKPIYRKMLNVSSLSIGINEVAVSDIDIIIKNYGACSISNLKRPLPFKDGENISSTVLQSYTSQIVKLSSSFACTNVKWFIEYTKNTD